MDLINSWKKTSIDGNKDKTTKEKRRKHVKYKVLIGPILMSVSLSPPVQWWLGRQVRCDRWLPEGGSWGHHYKAKVGVRDLVRRVLPEPEAWLQPEEPLVPRVLAASLPVSAEGTSAGEQHLQPHLHLLVKHILTVFTSKSFTCSLDRSDWVSPNEQVSVLHRERESAQSVRPRHQDGLRHKRHLFHGLRPTHHAAVPLSRI